MLYSHFQSLNGTLNPVCVSYTIIVTQQNETSLNKSLSGGQLNATFYSLKPYTVTAIEVITHWGHARAYRNTSSISPDIGNNNLG